MTDTDDIYTPSGPQSFLRDVMAHAGLPLRGVQPHEAARRLELHARSSNERLKQARKRALRELGWRGIGSRGYEGGAQSRALSNVAGLGGEMIPPRWMVERFASIARAAAPLKQLVTRVDLPPGTLELHVPRFDTSAGVVPEEYENVNPPQVLIPGTDEVVSKVATFAGDVLVSQQLYDRGGDFSDQIILKDFADNYAEALQSQMMVGSGSNGQLLGLTNVSTTSVDGVPGARAVTYTAGSPTPAGLIKAIGECAGEISDTRRRPPSAILMRGALWFDMASWPDVNSVSTERLGTGLIPTEADIGPFGPLAGLPVYHDNTLPTNLGSGANQTTVVLTRASDQILLEDPLGPRFTAYPVSNEAGQMTVVLGWHHYTAALTNLYPSAIGTVTGTGLVVPSGF